MEWHPASLQFAFSTVQCALPPLHLLQVYGEVFRVLKPGSIFMTYEWVTTPAFNASNKDHVACVDEIIIGNGLPVSAAAVRACCASC